MSDKETKKIGSGKPGPGRPKGCKNKLTASAKQAFQHAFDRIGGADALAVWAQENRTEFYRLFARLIPVEHGGEVGGTIIVRIHKLSGD